MKDTIFDHFEWHDAILQCIVIDRTNAGYDDKIELLITWQTGKSSKIIFKDVYRADLSMNFGIIAEEAILDAKMLNECDKDIVDIINKWQRHYKDIQKIKGFEITTSSTSSKLRIFAMDIVLENIL